MTKTTAGAEHLPHAMHLDTVSLFNHSLSAEDEFDYIARILSLHPSNNTTSRACENVLFGVHHKMGTALLRSIGRNMCASTTGWTHHATPKDYENYRLVLHMIRDPLETIVSGYQYHLVSDEQWLISSGHQKRLRDAKTLEDGLKIEYEWGMQHTIGEAIRMHEHLQANWRTESLTVRMDQMMASESEFRKIVFAIESWLDISQHLSWTTLQTCCFISNETRAVGAKHVSKSGEKDAMRTILMSRHGDEIRQARQQLGFALKGLEP